MDFTIILGTTGLLILLAAFAVEHIHRKKTRLYFNLLNMIGSLMLGVYAIFTANIIFVILEFLWAALSVIYIFRKE